MTSSLTPLFFGLATALTLTQPAMAADAGALSWDGLSVTTALGHSTLRGNELVYDEKGNRISHLVWTARVPVVNFGATADLGQGWSLRADATVKAGNDGYMTDYDWDDEKGKGFRFGQWTDRSIHPDTGLTQYVDARLAVSRQVASTTMADISVQGGLSYTRAAWSARGGSYIYTDAKFRDTLGQFDDGQRVISYRQEYGGVFVGTTAETRRGNWTFSGQVRAGMSLTAKDRDMHWLRDLRFDEEFDATPFVGLGLRASYVVNDRMSAFVAADHQQFRRAKGDVEVRTIETGLPEGSASDAAGMDFKATTLSAGVQVRF